MSNWPFSRYAATNCALPSPSGRRRDGRTDIGSIYFFQSTLNSCLSAFSQRVFVVPGRVAAIATADSSFDANNASSPHCNVVVVRFCALFAHLYLFSLTAKRPGSPRPYDSQLVAIVKQWEWLTAKWRLYPERTDRSSGVSSTRGLFQVLYGRRESSFCCSTFRAILRPWQISWIQQINSLLSH